MQIKQFRKFTLLDYPGKTACMIWTGGCNFRCPYCYNSDIVLRPASVKTIPKSTVMKYMRDERDWIEGIVVSGGEPTIHDDLPEFVKEIKKARFLFKLDTNGSRPAVLSKVIRAGADYIAMDIKAPLDDYKKYCKAGGCKPADVDEIKRSIDIVMKSGVDYEFRTTVVPGITSIEDVELIANYLTGAKRYVIQQFLPVLTLDRKLVKTKPYALEQLEEMRDKVRHNFEECLIRQ